MESQFIKDMAPVLNTAIWATLAFAVILLLNREIRKFLQRFACANELTVKVGQLSMQAKAFHEMKGSVDTVFNSENLTKDELNAFFDIKLKSVLSEINRTMTGSDPRSDNRIPLRKKIKIQTEDGDVFEGETLDISKAGISFKTRGRLGIFETVSIAAFHSDSESSSVSDLLDRAKIVRIELSKEGYHYGATVPSAASI